jgi:predicted esterase
MAPSWWMMACLAVACERGAAPSRPSHEPRSAAPLACAAPAPKPPAPAQKLPEAVRVESVTLADERVVFVLRGARGHKSGVFLHGLCGHGMGYLQSFQFAAAEHGPWVAPHGDVACSGAYRSWSGKIDAIHDQIRLGFEQAGVSELQDVTLVGYSLGATRALALARAQPDVYRELILIAAPSMPSPHGLTKVRAAVMMAGSRDRQDAMKAGARAFERAKIPSTYLVLPGAAHGEMGPDAERVMGEALAWLREHARRD